MKNPIQKAQKPIQNILKHSFKRENLNSKSAKSTLKNAKSHSKSANLIIESRVS